MPKVKIPASVIQSIVERNSHKLGFSKETLDAVSTKSKDAVIETEVKRLERVKQLDMFDRLKAQKEYNEKVSSLLHPNQRPAVVGIMNDEDPRKQFEFVRFDKIETKHPIEYINSEAIDYDVVNTNKENSKCKKDMPISFLAIKEGDIESGKEWYKHYDPKLPDNIAELMARHNWGDLKYMTKKSAKNQKKKLSKKGKDLGNEMGLTIKHADKNNPIIVKFD